MTHAPGLRKQQYWEFSYQSKRSVILLVVKEMDGGGA
jgi:hypothetical protein